VGGIQALVLQIGKDLIAQYGNPSNRGYTGPGAGFRVE
jgi:hypothetical protein